MRYGMDSGGSINCKKAEKKPAGPASSSLPSGECSGGGRSKSTVKADIQSFSSCCGKRADPAFQQRVPGVRFCAAAGFRFDGCGGQRRSDAAEFFGAAPVGVTCPAGRDNRAEPRAEASGGSQTTARRRAWGTPSKVIRPGGAGREHSVESHTGALHGAANVRERCSQTPAISRLTRRNRSLTFAAPCWEGRAGGERLRMPVAARRGWPCGARGRADRRHSAGRIATLVPCSTGAIS